MNPILLNPGEDLTVNINQDRSLDKLPPKHLYFLKINKNLKDNIPKNII